MSPRSVSHRPRQDWRALRDVSPTQGWISDPYLPCSALHGSHCLSRGFTWLAKSALEKQTRQLSLVLQQCMDSVWVWLLAGPRKCIRPSVTIRSVFQNPVTTYFAWADQKKQNVLYFSLRKCKDSVWKNITVMKLICYCFCSTVHSRRWQLHFCIPASHYIAGCQCSCACTFLNRNYI